MCRRTDSETGPAAPSPAAPSPAAPSPAALSPQLIANQSQQTAPSPAPLTQADFQGLRPAHPVPCRRLNPATVSKQICLASHLAVSQLSQKYLRHQYNLHRFTYERPYPFPSAIPAIAVTPAKWPSKSLSLRTGENRRIRLEI